MVLVFTFEIIIQKSNMLLCQKRRNQVAVIGTAVFDKIGDAINEHRRFSRAGTCQNEHGAIGRQHCFSLFGIERSKFLFDNFSS